MPWGRCAVVSTPPRAHRCDGPRGPPASGSSAALLTSVLYVDFGDNLPAGGFDLSATQLKDDFGSGGIQGPDLTAGSNKNPLPGADNLQFTSMSGVINFDYNNDGTANAQDYTDLKNAVIQLVQRDYAPFDVNVQVAPNLDTSSDTNYRNAIINQLKQGITPTASGTRTCCAGPGPTPRRARTSAASKASTASPPAPTSPTTTPATTARWSSPAP